MNPWHLTEEAIVEAMCSVESPRYRDFDDFAYDCHAVSLSLIRSGLLGTGGPDLRVARGSCLGVGGQHSWVVLGHPYDKDATIVDLTYWSYQPAEPRVWIGSQQAGFHRPKAFHSIFQSAGVPCSRGGPPLHLDRTGLGDTSQSLLDMIEPLDAAGWASFWSNSGMTGWPSREVLEAFLDQYPRMAALVPVDIIGMVTDRNPEGLYW